jgi:hypothetical protein
MSDLLGGLYFNTGNIDIDKRLFHLAHMSNPGTIMKLRTRSKTGSKV